MLVIKEYYYLVSGVRDREKVEWREKGWDREGTHM